MQNKKHFYLFFSRKMILFNQILILSIFYTKCLSLTEKIFLVADYGAYPNDNIDDSNEIQLVINTAINH